jgi:hypothetical protein
MWKVQSRMQTILQMLRSNMPKVPKKVKEGEKWTIAS